MIMWSCVKNLKHNHVTLLFSKPARLSRNIVAGGSYILWKEFPLFSKKNGQSVWISLKWVLKIITQNMNVRVVVWMVLSKHECHAIPLVLKKKGIITHSYLDLYFFALNWKREENPWKKYTLWFKWRDLHTPYYNCWHTTAHTIYCSG